MTRFAVRFAVAVFLAHAAYRIGSEYVTHLRFRDAVRAVATSSAMTDDDLRQRIMTLAVRHDVPLEQSRLRVQQTSDRVIVQGSYSRPIRLLPLYQYPWRFELSIETQTRQASRKAGFAR